VTDSFEQRISMAQDERRAAVRARDVAYPGTPEWESANATVERWDATIRDLRDQAQGR
jgi:hypothetical protein